MLPTRRSYAEQGGVRQSAAQGIAIARHRSDPKRLPREQLQAPLIYELARATRHICEPVAPPHFRGRPAPPCLA
jgi:hypothetical protein